MPGSGERIWDEDPRGFVSNDNLIKFSPDRNMTDVERLNAIMRFVIYFSILIMVVRRSLVPVFIVLCAGSLTWGMNQSRVEDERRRRNVLERMHVADTRHAGLCTKPTRRNPFMNVLPSELKDGPQRPRACDVSRSDVKRAMEGNFSHNLYRDADDPFQRNASSRQFYTVPVTTVPGDQTAFAKWLYGSGRTCKEGNGAQCSTMNPRVYFR